MAARIILTKLDAITLLTNGAEDWPEKTLVYLDPPYYAKGRDLYYNFYNHGDHAAVASIVQEKLTRQHWIVSYDNVEPICAMYAERRRAVYSIGYSARESRQGSEVMFFSDRLRAPALVGPITSTEEPPFTVAA